MIIQQRPASRMVYKTPHYLSRITYHQSRLSTATYHLSLITYHAFSLRERA